MNKLAALCALTAFVTVAAGACSGGGDQTTGEAPIGCAADQDCTGAGATCVKGACVEDPDFSPGLSAGDAAELGAVDPPDGFGAGGESTKIGDVIDTFCGIDAYQNGPDFNATFHSSAYGLKYQCTELSYRFVCQHYNLCQSQIQKYGNAQVWYDNHSDPVLKQLDRYPSGGTEPPRNGDIIVWNHGTYGHVAIVRSVAEGVVQVLEQNVFNGSHFYLMSTAGGKYSIKNAVGWMRLPGSAPACSDVTSTDHLSAATLSAPAAGTSVTGPVALTGEATDLDGLSKVTVTFGGAKAVAVCDGDCTGTSQSITATVDPATLGFAPGASIDVAVWVKDAQKIVKGPLATRTITWQPAGGGVFCGDGTCNGAENSSSCCTDCGCPGTQMCKGGVCAAGGSCGDGTCAGGENQSTCCADCGCPGGQMCNGVSCVAKATCGDGTCNGGESQSTCCADCGCPGGQMCNGASCVAMITCGDGICNGGENQSTCCNDCGCSNGESCGGGSCSCPAGNYGQFAVLNSLWPSFGGSGCSGDNTTMLKASAEMISPTTLRVHVHKSDDSTFGSAATLSLYVGAGPTCPDPVNVVKASKAVAVGAVDQTIDLVVNPYGASWTIGETKQLWVGKSEGGHNAWRASGVINVQRTCL
jgi:surface antigen